MSDSVLRLLKMTERIPRYPEKVTTNQMQDFLSNYGYSISLRTVQRDLIELSRLFPIVCDERSIPFGWSWEKTSPGVEFPNMDPLQALTLSLAAQYLEPILPKPNLESVEGYFDKAEKMLLGNEKSKISRWRKRVKVISETMRFKSPKMNKGIILDLHKAVYESKQIEALYRKRGMTKAEKRLIHPMGIVLKGSIHYLICMMDEDPINPRYLPLHRFEKTKLLDKTAKEPKNFNFNEFIHKNNLGFAFSEKLYVFEAIFDRTMAFHLIETPLNGTQSVKEIEENKLFVKARVPDTLQFEQWLMSFGDKVEILKPKKLRNKFKKISNNLNYIYK